jgi:peptidoglycan/xylan/chitin deacetylase (PgdA/CDA1 family)
VRAALGAQAPSWSPLAEFSDGEGKHLSSVWIDSSGSVLLPFDPDEVLLNYLSERYVDQLRRNGRGWISRALLRAYYRVRVLFPRRLQIWIRRRYARLQARTPFPRWPVEPGLHDFIELFLSLLAEVADADVPYIAPWPDGHQWALVLTHDVETSVGLCALDPLLEIEQSHGMRSSWNFVPRRYAVPDALVHKLQAAGFEVGVHGLYHDGRDLASLSGLQSRLPAIQAVAARWQAVGFRSPASHRRWEWMPLLGFDYDSSYPDTDPFEPQQGGCCSWWPFFNGDQIELPLTMPHDHTLFVILGHRDESVWVHKAQVLRERAGMALIVTHPDYLRQGPGLAAYDRLLSRFAGDSAAWMALPAEVSAWWRRRAASSVVWAQGGWAITGPAQDRARVVFARGRRGC